MVWRAQITSRERMNRCLKIEENNNTKILALIKYLFVALLAYYQTWFMAT